MFELPSPPAGTNSICYLHNEYVISNVSTNCILSTVKHPGGFNRPDFVHAATGARYFGL